MRHQVKEHGGVSEAAKNLQSGFFECPFCKKLFKNPYKHKKWFCKLNPAKQPSQPHPQTPVVLKHGSSKRRGLDKITSTTKVCKSDDAKITPNPPDRRYTIAEVERREHYVLERFTIWLVKFENKSKSTAVEYCKIIQKMAKFWRRTLSPHFCLRCVEIQYLPKGLRIPCSENFVHSLETNDLKQLALSSYIALCSYAKFKIEETGLGDSSGSDEFYDYMDVRFKDVEKVSVEASSALKKLTRND